MSERSLQVSVEDLQHIQLHLEGQEQALAAIAEHLRAFESDAGQFVQFQSDFIKTIGLIQDVHQHTKQQAQQWREQLEQCSTAHQNTLQLQADTASELSASTERLSNELKTTLQQQQNYFEQIKAAMVEHENLLSKHQSVGLLKKIPDSIQQMTQRLSEALTRVDQVAASLSKIESQQARQAEQLSAKNAKQFADIEALLNRHKKEQQEQHDHKQSVLQQQLDQRFSDFALIVQQSLEQLRQDQAHSHAQRQRVLRAGLSFIGLLLLLCLMVLIYGQMQ